MLVAMHVSITPDFSRQRSFPEGRGLCQRLKKAMHFVLAIALSSLVLGSGGCAGTDKHSETNLPSSEPLQNYLQSANHLDEKQKEDMALRRPFVGMTMDEANLAMRRESTKLILSGKATQAVYVGGSGVRYQIYFQGEPPKVVNWTAVSDEQIELTDPDLLRPTPPVGPF